MKLREMRCLSFFASVKVGNQIFVSNLRYNGLYSIDIDTYEVNFVGRFPNYSENFLGLHESVQYYDNKLFFFPHYGSAIDVYDLDKNQFYGCKLHSWEKNKRSDNFTCSISAYRCGDFFYLLPRFPNMPMVKYSIQKNEVVEEISLNLSDSLRNKEAFNLTSGSVKIEDKIFYPLFDTNIIMVYDITTGKESYYEIEGVSQINGAMGFDGSAFWINAENDIVVCDSNFVVMKKMKGCVTDEERLIVNFVFRDKWTYAVPANLGALKRFDLSEDVCESIKIEETQRIVVNDVIAKWRNLGTIQDLGNTFLLNPVNLDRAFEVNYQEGTIHPININAPIESVISKNKFSRTALNVEKYEDDLEEFLSFIADV